MRLGREDKSIIENGGEEVQEALIRGLLYGKGVEK